MKFNLHFICLLLLFLMLQACVSTDSSVKKNIPNKTIKLNDSYLMVNEAELSPGNLNVRNKKESQITTDSFSNYQQLEPIKRNESINFSTKLINEIFSTEDNLSVKAFDLPLIDYIQYVFGELLEVNYILESGLESKTKPIIININNNVSSRSLFDIASKQLSEQNISIKYVDNVFYFSQEKKSELQTIVSIGRDKASVPNTSQSILQIVPIKYGLKNGLSDTLKSLVKAKITNDFQQNVIFIEGNREQIIRTLDFIELLDAPAMRGKAIGLIEFTYITPDSFTDEVQILLETEGVPVAKRTKDGSNVVILPIRQISSVVVFASSQDLLGRVKYWGNLLDKPSKGEDLQFYTFRPKFARATDIGVSIQNLLSTTNFQNSNNTVQRESTGSAPNRNRTGQVANKDLKMVVDDRTNSLIFYTSGEKYQSILPLLSELDVLPKQIFLDITIAEVSMKDEFKFGVEFAIEKGSFDISTIGAFGGSNLGGLGLLYNGPRGPVTANMLNTSSLVKVLSKPTILVRDGMTSNINIGSQVSIVGATTSNLLTGTTAQTTTTEYINTGVNITVTPTVNAEDVVIMQISQSISNTVADSNGAGGNPDIFNRQLNTEVIAKSGQTILLAGLISENNNSSSSGAPFLSKIPLLGKIFESEGDNNNRTELIMLITPRVMENLEQFSDVKESLKESINFLEF